MSTAQVLIVVLLSIVLAGGVCWAVVAMATAAHRRTRRDAEHGSGDGG